MYPNENQMLKHEEELVDILLDFIIVAANLTQSINYAMKLKQTMKGGIDNESKN